MAAWEENHAEWYSSLALRPRCQAALSKDEAAEQLSFTAFRPLPLITCVMPEISDGEFERPVYVVTGRHNTMIRSVKTAAQARNLLL